MRLTPAEKELQRRDPELHASVQVVSSKIARLLEFLERYGLQPTERDLVVGRMMSRLDEISPRIRPVIEEKWTERPDWGRRGDKGPPVRVVPEREPPIRPVRT